jgi:hypothetical protein
MIMKTATKLFSLVITGLLVSAAATRADDLAAASNPYASLVQRNVFGLVPIPDKPAVEPPPVEPPVKITLTGIMNIFGKFQAIFKTPGAAKPGLPAKEESYVLTEGERQDDIEVKKINDTAGVVTFDNHGVIQELPLEIAKNVPAPTAPVAGVPAPSGPTLTPAVPGAFGGGRFGRAMRATKNVTSSDDLQKAQQPALPQSADTKEVNANGVYQPAIPNAAEALSPEAQVILIEAQRQKYKDDNNPIANMLPPTPITPAEGK